MTGIPVPQIRYENMEESKLSKKLDRERKRKKVVSDHTNKKAPRLTALDTKQYWHFQQKQKK